MESKAKLFKLFLMAYGNFQIGTLDGILGTTIPDLQCIFQADLSSVASLFLTFGIATGVACIFSSFLLKICNIYLVMIIVVLLLSIGIALVAITHYIEVAHSAMFIAGLATGLGYTGNMCMCNLLFSDSDYAFHVLGLCLSAGNILSPIIARPFLGKIVRNESTPLQSTTLTNRSIEQFQESTLASFQPYLNVQTSNITQNGSAHVLSYCDTTSSAVNYAYIILGSLGMPLAFMYCVCFIIGTNSDDRCAEISHETYIQLNDRKTRTDYIFIAFLIILLPGPSGLPFAYGNYLTTIGVKEPLQLTIQDMVLLLAVYWLQFLIGRTIFTAVSFMARQIVIIYICSFGQIFSVILLVLTESTVFLWIGSLSMGFFSGPLFAAIVAWSRIHISLTPFVLGMLSLSNCIGVPLMPFVSGQVISVFGVKAQNYFCLTMTLAQLVMFLGLHALSVFMNIRVEIKESETCVSNSAKVNPEETHD